MAAIREHPPELVLTDVMMPNLDGFGLLRALRSDAKTGPFPSSCSRPRRGRIARGRCKVERTTIWSNRSAPVNCWRACKPISISRGCAGSRSRRWPAAPRSRSGRQRVASGVFLVDSRFRILEINPTTRAAGGNIPALIGSNLDKVLHLLWPKPMPMSWSGVPPYP